MAMSKEYLGIPLDVRGGRECGRTPRGLTDGFL